MVILRNVDKVHLELNPEELILVLSPSNHKYTALDWHRQPGQCATTTRRGRRERETARAKEKEIVVVEK